MLYDVSYGVHLVYMRCSITYLVMFTYYIYRCSIMYLVMFYSIFSDVYLAYM